MIESVVCTIIVLSLANFYLSYCIGNSTPFDLVYNVSLTVIFIHASHVLFCEVFYPNDRYVDSTAPFGLIYGPLCYFSFYTASGKALSRNRVIPHLIPFIIGLVFYVIILTNPSFRVVFYKDVIYWLYLFIFISLVGYTGILLLFNNADENKLVHEGKKIVVLVLLLVFILALFFLAVRYVRLSRSENTNTPMTRTIIYLLMLFIVGIAFRYNVNRIINNMSNLVPKPLPQNLAIEDAKKQRYQKSIIADELLIEYHEKLERVMKVEKYYLDAELTLEKLAASINVPKQYLTQVLNLRIGKNFYQYINVFRIEHACRLLQQDALDFKLEEIALQSGFNSKTSFNRYFKTITGYTPSDYKTLRINS